MPFMRTPTTLQFTTPIQQSSSHRTRSQTFRSAVTPPSLHPSEDTLDRLRLENYRLREELGEDKASLKLWRENALLKQHSADLEQELEELRGQRDAAQTHAVFAGQQASLFQYKFNEKVKKKTSRRVRTSARIFTTDEGRADLAQSAAAKAIKDNQVLKKLKKKDDTFRADIIRRAEQDRLGTEFLGNMNQFSKPALVDIANAVKIPHKGALVDLRTRLKAHFDANPELKTDRRYIGLFKRSRKRKDPPKENIEGSSRRPRLDFRFPSPSPVPSSSHPPLFHSHSPVQLSPSRHFGLENPPRFNGALFQAPSTRYAPDIYHNPYNLRELPMYAPQYTVPAPHLPLPSLSVPRPLPRPLPRSSTKLNTNSVIS
ncbi:hypothetical protein D9757_007787 [Collybiopsis confluens]|uniref:Uncharacterized protein n=1 Tax=Collybiopsis confluens TaxID=2823264 RepID=A0A8H5HPV5_9AGAR|nr:hypothetical protein D9757_007813 [Collybiopsis confluens]KAF5387464.1 hypothetical protein D9757_007787 [Collybiopsis confluens]